jgi:hypothetical protein
VHFFNSEIVVSGDASGRTRFWNIKDGTEAQGSVAGGNFTFSKGASKKQQVGRHVIAADGDLVLVHVMKNGKGSKEGEDAEDAMPVACFRAPAGIDALDCAGDEIAVGCASGDVLHLRAASPNARCGIRKALEAVADALSCDCDGGIVQGCLTGCRRILALCSIEGGVFLGMGSHGLSHGIWSVR